MCFLMNTLHFDSEEGIRSSIDASRLWSVCTWLGLVCMIEYVGVACAVKEGMKGGYLSNPSIVYTEILPQRVKKTRKSAVFVDIGV